MKKISTLFFLSFSVLAAYAQPFIRWDFEQVETPSFGTGSFSLSPSLSAGFNSTYPSGAQGFAINTTNYPAISTGSGTTGVTFATSTEGKTGIVVSLVMRHSNSSSRYVQFQYSSNGSTFQPINLTPDNASARLMWGGDMNLANSVVDYTNDVFGALSGNNAWFRRTVDLSSIPEVNNNPNFAFRIVTVFEPGTNSYTSSTTNEGYAPTGTLRFDSVVVAANGTLPIRLTTFSGQVLKNSVKLNWNTSDETDGKHFELERSANGVTFSKLATISLQTSQRAAIVPYEFIDNQPGTGNNWYRLKMVHRDGTGYFSKVIKVAYSVQGLAISPVYPTVVSNRLLVNLQSDKNRQVEAVIYNQLGQQMAKQVFTAQVGSGNFEMPVSGLNEGMYRVIFQANGTIISSQAFIKQ